MEHLAPLGTAIQDIVLPTHKIYAPLLLKQADKIRSTRRETFAYGQHPRQKLDVYTPSAGVKSVTGKSSVFIFLYGGGLVRGEKINTNYLDGLVYANLGHYFAENLGFEVVIIDYRLITHGAKFPSGGEDLKLAIDWVLGHFPKPLDIYMMGNSAGGVHLSTYLFAPDFATSRRQILSASSAGVLKGVILLSVPFHFEQAHADRRETLRAYFGDNVRVRCPLGLLEASKQDRSISELQQVPVMVSNGTLDPEDEILVPRGDFIKEWKASGAVTPKLTVQMMEGHNHLSPVLAVGTAVPAEEAWARQAIDFIIASSRT
ncbi:Alpha/Beta hydrolase protein [Exophiala viscosa]|uniref:Alpha/Beta hydrolase protein n=1 Tax=Exophiala viscosa TaxID=2486360 RepID=A0AAN6DYV4_9EURO|nr:Alpha/Beta hydrolase protein [Exophiala viscosa]